MVLFSGLFSRVTGSKQIDDQEEIVNHEEKINEFFELIGGLFHKGTNQIKGPAGKEIGVGSHVEFVDNGKIFRGHVIALPDARGAWAIQCHVDARGILTYVPIQQLRPVTEHRPMAGSGVEVLYQGAWCTGYIVMLPADDVEKLGRYTCQCHDDPEGVYTYADSETMRPLLSDVERDVVQSALTQEGAGTTEKHEEKRKVEGLKLITEADEEKRIAAQAAAKAEAQRLKAEAKAEQERLAAEAAAIAEAERLALEAHAKALHERLAKVEAERIAAEAAAQAEAQRLRAEARAKAEQERLAAEVAPKQGQVRTLYSSGRQNNVAPLSTSGEEKKTAEATAKEEAERLEATAQAEQERLAAEAAAKADAERLALEVEAKVEQESFSVWNLFSFRGPRNNIAFDSTSEKERIKIEVAATAEAQRLEAEAKAEQKRLAAEEAAKAEAERRAHEAKAKAEQKRLASETAARVKAERLKAEKERLAEVEKKRIAAEAVAKARAKRLDPEAEAKAEQERLWKIRAKRLEAEAKAEAEQERRAAEMAAKAEANRPAVQFKANDEQERFVVANGEQIAATAHIAPETRTDLAPRSECFSVLNLLSFRGPRKNVAPESTIEKERMAIEVAATAEADRLEAEANADKERLEADAAAKAEAERRAHEAKAIEAAARAEAERRAHEAKAIEAAARAEAERLAREAEARKRIAVEAVAKARAKRLEAEAKAKAEQDRLAAKAAAKQGQVQTFCAGHSHVASEVRVGQQRFRVEHLLGQGSFSSVWSAISMDGQRVAVKATRCHSQQTLADAEREAQILKSISGSAERSPTLFASETQQASSGEKVVSIAMSKMIGGPLSVVMQRYKRDAAHQTSMQIDKACTFALELLGQLVPTFKAISTVALHRDISMENVLVDTARGSSRLDFSIIDFGLAVETANWPGLMTQIPVVGCCCYWPVSAWYIFCYGGPKLLESRLLRMEYETQLDLHALGILALQVFITMIPQSAVDCMPQEIRATKRAWEQYWQHVSVFWDPMLKVSRGQGDWTQVRQIFIASNASVVIDQDLGNLRVALEAARLACDRTNGLHDARKLFAALMKLISQGGKSLEQEGSFASWSQIEKILTNDVALSALKATKKTTKEKESLEDQGALNTETDRVEVKARAEQKRIAAEAAARAEAERLALEAEAKVEQERLAKIRAKRLEAEAKAKAEQERLAAEAAAKADAERREAEAKAEQERLWKIRAKRLEAEAKAKAEQERLAAEVAAKAEAERLSLEAKAEQERLAKAEEQRIAAEAAAIAEAERIEAETKAERIRLAEVERERIAAEAAAKAEAERLEAGAKAKAEQERLTAESAAKAEAERLALEAEAKVKQERLAKEEEERVAAEAAAKAEAARLEARARAKAVKEKLAAEAAAKAEVERLALEAEAKAKRLEAEARMKAEQRRRAAEAAAKAEAERLALKSESRTLQERLARARKERLAAEAATKGKQESPPVEAVAKVEAESKARKARAKAEGLGGSLKLKLTLKPKWCIEAEVKAEEERIAAVAATTVEKEKLAAEAAAKVEAERMAREVEAKAEEERKAGRRGGSLKLNLKRKPMCRDEGEVKAEKDNPTVTPRTDQERVVVTFQPGPIGFGSKDGYVIDKVVDGSQAKRAGVEVGWKLLAVGPLRCTNLRDKVLQNAMKGNAPYRVVFAKASNTKDTLFKIPEECTANEMDLSVEGAFAPVCQCSDGVDVEAAFAWASPQKEKKHFTLFLS